MSDDMGKRLSYDDQLSQAITDALRNSMTPEITEGLVSNAIQSLLTPRSSNYSDRPRTPIQDAFNTAVSKIAQDEAEKHIRENPDFLALMRASLNAAMVQAMAKDRDIREQMVKAAMRVIERDDD